MNPSVVQAQQRFTKGDSTAFIKRCHIELEDYISGLNAAGLYCGSQGEFVQKQQTLIAQSFLDKETFVYSDLVGEGFPVQQYIQQFRLYRGEATVDPGKARYLLSRNKAGKPVVIAYVSQTTEYEKPGTSRTRKTTPLAIHYTFDLVAGSTGFEPENYKIVKIENARAIPPKAESFPADVDIIALREKERSLSWTAYRLARSIAEKLPNKQVPLVVRKFSYDNSQLTNAFSDQLADELRHRLKSDGINVIADDRPQGQGIRGSYQQRGNQVEITTELFDLSTDKSITTLAPNRDLPVTWVLQKGLKLKPEDNDAAITTQQTITAEAPTVSPAASTPLQIALKASGRVRKSLEFWEGDTMTVGLRVNKPCFVRLVYVQTDGAVAFLDEMEIKADQINKDILLPRQFECVPPFGQETLLAAASTTRFCPLQTQENQFGSAIIAGTLKDALKNTRCVDRGMRNLPELTETRLVLTTRGAKTLAQK
ncbi:hypothetical protein GCM10023187_32180 [Nibrella viscosa]|uniref:DUF4384 domain-containing protein n=2 Tax=Nibrella viscosa TaxID=1084524 RepID=A0ABP8KLT3_9BACT